MLFVSVHLISEKSAVGRVGEIVKRRGLGGIEGRRSCHILASTCTVLCHQSINWCNRKCRQDSFTPQSFHVTCAYFVSLTLCVA
jgi:hypothetical protein